MPVMTKALGLLNALKHGMDVPATDGTIGGIPIINLVNQAALEVVVPTPDPAGITSYDARKSTLVLLLYALVFGFMGAPFFQLALLPAPG